MSEMIKTRLFSILFFVFLFVLILLQTYTHNTIDMDYWARLLQGNAFWQLGHILKIDPFSYTQTHLWLDHEWGSSVVFSFIHNTFGFNGVLIFRTIIVFLIFFFIYKTIKLNVSKINKPLLFLLFTFAMSAMPSLLHSGLRCHFFSFLFFTVYIYILENVRKTLNYKLLFILPVLMLIWANMHGGCVSGLGLIGLYLFGEYINKKEIKPYLYCLIVSLLMLFINPYGFDYVKFIFMATTMSRPFVTEWISPFQHPVWNFFLEFKLFYLASIFLTLYSFKKSNKDNTKFLVLLVCAFVSCKYIKNTPFFIIVSLIFLYKDICFEKIEKIKWVIILAIVFIFGLNVKSFFTERTFYLSQQPVKVVEFIDINNLRGNILAPFDMGSYIVYKLYPNNLIYMDGRYEEVYFDKEKKLIDKFYNAEEDYDLILNQEIKPDYIIVPTDAIVNDLMINNKQYKLIYQDENETLYSSVDKLKKMYILPTNRYYSFENAFKTKFNFTDEIILNGEKVIFK